MVKKNRKHRHMLRRIFVTEIRKTRARFFSIMLIVALGTAFYAGVRVTEPDMTSSADSYYDSADMMDIRVVSTQGLTDDDVAALRQIQGVETVEPTHSVDVLAQCGDTELQIKVLGETEQLNRLTVISGRMPQKENECLVDTKLEQFHDVKIGDTLTLSSGEKDESSGDSTDSTDSSTTDNSTDNSTADSSTTDSSTTDNSGDLSDTLSSQTFTVVGTCTYPYYLSLERGTTTVGSGTLDGFIMIPDQTFTEDYYTEIFLSVSGAKALNCYEDDYDDLVTGVSDRIDAVKDARAQARYEEIMAKGQKKIDDAQTELSDARDEADTKLADAEKKIEDAQKKIDDAKATVAEKEQDLADAEKKIAANEKKLNDAQKKLTDAKKQYESGVTELNAQKKKLAAAKEELEAKAPEIAAAKEQIAAARTQLDTAKTQLSAGWKQYEDGLAQMTAAGASEEEAKQALSGTYDKLTASQAELDAQEKELDSKEAELTAGEKQITEGEKQIAAAEKKLAAAKKEIASGETELASGKKQLASAKEKIASGKKKLDDAKKKISDGEDELTDARKKYQDAKQEANDKIADAQTKIDDGEADLKKIKVGKWYVLDRDTLQTVVEYGMDSERIGAIGKLFPLIFFLVAALVSLTTMTRMVEEEREEIGTLKALGYHKGAIAMKYFAYALFATLIGSVGGIFIGEKILPYVIITEYRILYSALPVIETPIRMGYGLTATAAAVACITAATLLACYRELAEQPAELMRPEAPKNGKRILLERVTFLWKHLNFTQKASIRNMFRCKKRFFMTVFGIAGCMALLLVGFGLKDSIYAMTENQYRNLHIYEAVVSLDDEADTADTEAALTAMNQAEGVRETMQVREESVDIEANGIVKSVNTFVPEAPERISDFVVLRSRTTHEGWTLPEDGVIITEKAAKLLNITAGDTITVHVSDTVRKEIKVTAVTENYLYHYIYMTPAVYEKLFGEAPVYNQVLLRDETRDETFENGLADRLLQQKAVTQVQFIESFQKRVDDIMSNLNVVVYVLIISAGLLAFVVLYNLNNINIDERRRELATLKVLGFYNGETANYVFRENIMLTFIGAVVGIGFGLVLHRFVILTAEIDMIMFGRAIRPVSFLYSFLLTFLFSLVVNWAMYFKLKKIDMVESMKSVE